MLLLRADDDSHQRKKVCVQIVGGFAPFVLVPFEQPAHLPHRDVILCVERHNLETGIFILLATEWRTAIGFYENLIQYSPNSYRVINNLGMEYADKGINDKAEATYLKAIALDPNNPVAYHNIAGTYRDTGRVDLALQAFRKAVELDPKFIFSYKSLAQIYVTKKDYPSARKALEEYFNRSDEQQQTIPLLIYLAELEGNMAALHQYLLLDQALNPHDPKIAESIKAVEKKLRGNVQAR